MMRELFLSAWPLTLALVLFSGICREGNAGTARMPNEKTCAAFAPPAGGRAGRGERELQLETAETGAPHRLHSRDEKPLGSGDGRIHVIPALSAPSVKNGGRLTIQAVVRAAAGVARVEAVIEGVTRLELKPAAPNRGTGILPVIPGTPAGVSDQNHGRAARATMFDSVMNHGQDARATINGRPLMQSQPDSRESVTLYQADWTAQGLEEKIYPVTLRVTDQAGHVFEERSLSFSDPAAGNSTVGNPVSPVGVGLAFTGTLALDPGENAVRCALVDTTKGYAYFGTYAQGKIMKVRLADFTRVGTLDLKVSINCGVIDPARGYAYFGAKQQSTAQIIKVRLSDFTLAGSLTLNSEEKEPYCAVIDPAGGHAYFGTASAPDDATSRGSVVKVRLSDFTRAGALRLNDGEDLPACAVIDPAKGFAGFGVSGLNAAIIKVRLSDMTRAGTLGGFNKYACAVIDPAGGYAYFGFRSWPGPGVVARVRLSDMTHAGRLTLTSLSSMTSAVIDPAAGYAWFGTTTSPGHVVKIRLSDFSVVQDGTMWGGEESLESAAIDPAGGYAYFGTWSWPGRLVKVRLSDCARVGGIKLHANEGTPDNAVIDPVNRHAYFCSSTPPGSFIKIRLSDFSRVGALVLNDEESAILCATIDPAGGHAYLATATMPGRIVKVRLSDLSRVGTLTLNSGEGALQSAVIDPAGGYAYFGSASATQGSVVKIRLSDFTRAGTLTLNPGEVSLRSAVIDPAGGYAYFGTLTAPGKVVKVRLSDLTRVGALALNESEEQLNCAVIDSSAEYAYFGTETYSGPGKVIKVRLSDLTRVGALTLNQVGPLNAAVMDAFSSYAYFCSISGFIAQVRLSDFNQSGSVMAPAYANGFASMVFDPAVTNIYCGTAGSPSGIHKVTPSSTNALHANRVTLGERSEVKDLRFYSHAAKGNVRLAVYSDEATKKLLWQSGATANAMANNWMTIPVAAGTPKTLKLAPGKYWLAWQSDSTAPVGSCAAGTAGEGFSVAQPFGAFPATLGAEQISWNSERWSEYLTYESENAAVEWRMYR